MKFHELLLRHGRIIGLGFALTFLSSFGQTFFISLSVPDIRDAFGLTNGSFGLIYSMATLASGLLMIWAGSVLDRVSVRLYATVALAGLACAALSLSFAQNLAVLGLSIFALRLCGQGMLGHAAVTSTARLPEAARGRAVGIATLGLPTGEATLPGVAIAVIAFLGWLTLWRTAAFIIVTAVAAGWLLGWWFQKRNNDLKAPVVPETRPNGAAPRRIEILRDWRFIAFIPTLIAPGAIFTAYFFHQRFIAQAKGWPLELLASSITLYAIIAVIATMVTGSLVDRFGAVRISRVYLLGLAGASTVLATVSGPSSAPFFFGLMGLTAGANNVVVPAVLAEFFGTRNLGMVRALAASIMVVATATTPGAVGLLFDASVDLPTLALCFAAYLVLTSGLNFLLPNPRVRR